MSNNEEILSEQANPTTPVQDESVLENPKQGRRRQRKQNRRNTDSNRIRRRAARRQPHIIYEGSRFSIPDLLQTHILSAPPEYSTLPMTGTGRLIAPSSNSSSRNRWRNNTVWNPRDLERSRFSINNVSNGSFVQNGNPFNKSCCGIAFSQTVSIRWFIVMIAFVGICCSVVGTALGAMKTAGREHLTVSLLMIGVGIVLITVSGIAWRLTSNDSPSCSNMLGIGRDSACPDYDDRFLPRPPHSALPSACVRAQHPYSAMMYSDYQYRPPPPSYQASMQEYRLRLLLDRNQHASPSASQPVRETAAIVSPPPVYRFHSRTSEATPVSLSSRPPSYRSSSSAPNVQILPARATPIATLTLSEEYSNTSFTPSLSDNGQNELIEHATVHHELERVSPELKQDSISSCVVVDQSKPNPDMMNSDYDATKTDDQFYISGEKEGDDNVHHQKGIWTDKKHIVTIVQGGMNHFQKPQEEQSSGGKDEVVTVTVGSLTSSLIGSSGELEILAHL